MLNSTEKEHKYHTHTLTSTFRRRIPYRAQVSVSNIVVLSYSIKDTISLQSFSIEMEFTSYSLILLLCTTTRIRVYNIFHHLHFFLLTLFHFHFLHSLWKIKHHIMSIYIHTRKKINKENLYYEQLTKKFLSIFLFLRVFHPLLSIFFLFFFSIFLIFITPIPFWLAKQHINIHKHTWIELE